VFVHPRKKDYDKQIKRAIDIYIEVMIQLYPAKSAKLKTAEQHFTKRYGKPDTPARMVFEERTLSWYYSEVLKEHRKKLEIT
jgi:hypothetical protein